MRMKMKLKILISLSCISLSIIFFSWQYFYGKFVGQNIKEVVYELKLRDHMVIDPINELDIINKCGYVNKVSLIPDSIISLIVISVDKNCRVSSIRIGWRM